MHAGIQILGAGGHANAGKYSFNWVNFWLFLFLLISFKEKYSRCITSLDFLMKVRSVQQQHVAGPHHTGP